MAVIDIGKNGWMSPTFLYLDLIAQGIGSPFYSKWIGMEPINGGEIFCKELIEAKNLMWSKSIYANSYLNEGHCYITLAFSDFMKKDRECLNYKTPLVYRLIDLDVYVQQTEREIRTNIRTDFYSLCENKYNK